LAIPVLWYAENVTPRGEDVIRYDVIGLPPVIVGANHEIIAEVGSVVLATTTILVGDPGGPPTSTGGVGGAEATPARLYASTMNVYDIPGITRGASKVILLPELVKTTEEPGDILTKYPMLFPTKGASQEICIP